MDNEVNQGITIAITLGIVSFVIGIIVFVSAMGQNFSRETINYVTDVNSANYASDVRSLENYNEAIPAASMYVALDKNRAAVKQVTGVAYGVTINSADDLKKLFSKQVKATITPIQGMYIVTISES